MKEIKELIPQEWSKKYLTMHDRPFESRLVEIWILREPDSDGSSLLVGIPNPDFKPSKYRIYEELNERANYGPPSKTKLLEPQPPYAPLSDDEYKKILIQYDVTKNPPSIFGKIESTSKSSTDQSKENPINESQDNTRPILAQSATNKNVSETEDVKPNDQKDKKLDVAEISSSHLAAKYGPLKGVCCVQPGDKIKGTFFIGGAGIDGIYIPKMVESFHNAGIKSSIYLDREKWSASIFVDATFGVAINRDYDPNFPMLLRSHNNSYEQFNLIGYSFGSLIAAQLAMKYSLKGTIINYLVLIATPMSTEFLEHLRGAVNIRNIIMINLDEHGDPIYVGIGMSELAFSSVKLYEQMNDDDGHFYYAGENKVGNGRRNKLATELYRIGLR